MTDITKAIAFAKECLKWPDPNGDFSECTEIVWSADRTNCFDLCDADSFQMLLEEFLANRLFIQINRGTTSLFQWSVIVGLQDISGKGASWENARSDSDDLYDAIFDACVQAARMFPQ